MAGVSSCSRDPIAYTTQNFDYLALCRESLPALAPESELLDGRRILQLIADKLTLKYLNQITIIIILD